MQIHYMRVYFWSPYLSHITRSNCTVPITGAPLSDSISVQNLSVHNWLWVHCTDKEARALLCTDNKTLVKWFPTFPVRRPLRIIWCSPEHKIFISRDSWTTSANLADHQRSAEHTLGIPVYFSRKQYIQKNYSRKYIG